MYFSKSERNNRKNKIFIRFKIIVCFVVTFFIGCRQVNDNRSSECDMYQFSKEIKESLEKDNSSEKWTQEEIDAMLAAIQKQYLFDKWYYNEENIYYLGNDYSEDRIPVKSEDLEEVIFYQDQEDTIYFIPTSMVNKVIIADREEIQVREYHNGEEADCYLYRCTFCKTEWERKICPAPDNEYVDIFCSMRMQERLEELNFIGISKLPFPENITGEVIRNRLYENEYTDAVVEIIHSYFHNRKMYGEYQIYFDLYSYDQHEYEQHDYKIAITVAIVGEETSYWWIFRAKDILDEDERVIVETNGGANHSSPASYEDYNGIYAKGIEMAIRASRLVIPLTITESDEVKELGSFKDEDDLNTIHYYLKK